MSILGVGLLGGSIGLALRRAGFRGRISGLGHRQSSLDAALASGAIDAGFLSLPEAVAGADLVILATAVGLFEPMLRELGKLLPDGTVVTDVGSTKKQVVAWAKKHLPAGVRFVGSHPIAGSDQRGIQYARADLFDGACCVVTPLPLGDGDPKGRVRAVDAIELFWQSLGMWTVRMTPSAHDRALARVSHLPHATAAALMLLSDPSAQDLAGNGLLDSTRIAGGDPELWRDIFLTNGPEVVRAIRAMGKSLDRLAGLIARGDGRGLVKYLAEAQRRRAALMARRLKRRRVEG